MIFQPNICPHRRNSQQKYIIVLYKNDGEPYKNDGEPYKKYEVSSKNDNKPSKNDRTSSLLDDAPS